MGENVGHLWPFWTGTTTTLPSYGSIKGRSSTVKWKEPGTARVRPIKRRSKE